MIPSCTSGQTEVLYTLFGSSVVEVLEVMKSEEDDDDDVGLARQEVSGVEGV